MLLGVWAVVLLTDEGSPAQNDIVVTWRPKMRVEGSGPEVVVRVRDIGEYELLFAATDYARNRTYGRRRRRLRQLGSQALAITAAGSKSAGFEELRLEQDSARLALGAVELYVAGMLAAGELDSVECHLVAKGLQVLDGLSAGVGPRF
jgi:hypothetical protein